MHFTPLGAEFESVIAATIMFLAGGALSFICCFCITHGYIWHKRRIYRNRLRHEWSEGTDSTATVATDQQLTRQQQQYQHQIGMATQKRQSKQFSDRSNSIDQQQQLRRVVVVEAKVPANKRPPPPPPTSMNSTKERENELLAGNLKKKGQREADEAREEEERRKLLAAKQQRRKMTTNGVNGRGNNVAFDCGSTSTEETNCS